MKCCDSNLWPLDERHLANNEEEYRGEEEAKVKVVYSGQECRRTGKTRRLARGSSTFRSKKLMKLRKWNMKIINRKKKECRRTESQTSGPEIFQEKRANHQSATQCFATFLASMQHEDDECKEMFQA